MKNYEQRQTNTTPDAPRKTAFYPEWSIREHLIKMHGELPDGNNLEKSHKELHLRDSSTRDRIKKRGYIIENELLQLSLVAHAHDGMINS